MKQIWVITKKELKCYFDSLQAYIIIFLFLGFTGFFTWLYGADIFYRKEASLDVFFNISFWTLFVFIPLITMRSIAEENNLGTLEIVLTKPINEWQLVTGKFIAVFLLVCITLAMTLPYYITVWSIGPIDHGAVWCGYFALLLMSAAYSSIGIFASSLTKNQIVAALITFFILVFFHIISGILSTNMKGFFGEMLNYLSTRTHFDALIRGVIDTKNIIYFLSITFLGLLLSEIMIAKRNISEN